MLGVVQEQTAALVARATTLRSELDATWASSRALIARARQLISKSWPLRGGSDAAESEVGQIVAMIQDAPMCLRCIARKLGVQPDQATAALRSVAASLRLAVGIRRCAFCLERRRTFGV